MKIAIQAADLDAKRIDGTRVYILNLLKFFGQLDITSKFLLYHKKEFNPELIPPDFSNYEIIQKSAPFLWTQTRFAYELKKDLPDVLWMPMQALPIMRPRGMKTVITVHDLAFKVFPAMFPKKDLWQLNFYANYAIKNADKIIAVSVSTKKDILRFYPKIDPQKICVIYHGFDAELFFRKIDGEVQRRFRAKYLIDDAPYLLYVGAIQPRKNLITLIEAFGKLKATGNYPKLKLVLAGAPAWQAESTLEAVQNSHYSKEIVLTGRVSFSDLAKFYRCAKMFIFPSLYEGFGIPILESFASGTPVICANNSSLPEVAGDSALYFTSGDVAELEAKIKEILENAPLRESLIKKGYLQLEKFSWEKCAEETLEFIKS